MAADEWSHQKLALQHSGKFINLMEYRHRYQKRWSSEVMGAGSLSHVEGKRQSLFFFITANNTHQSSAWQALENIISFSICAAHWYPRQMVTVSCWRAHLLMCSLKFSSCLDVVWGDTWFGRRYLKVIKVKSFFEQLPRRLILCCRTQRKKIFPVAFQLLNSHHLLISIISTKMWFRITGGLIGRTLKYWRKEQDYEQWCLLANAEPSPLADSILLPWKHLLPLMVLAPM